MDIFLADTKLNISTAYLRPGFAFGGSCLPKDLRALMHTARRHDLDVPVLAGVLASNEAQVRRAMELITASGRRRIAILGLSFKAGTDDMRESPLVELAERLSGKGYDVRIFDPTVSLSRIVGANQTYLEEHLSHIADMLTDDAADVLTHAEVCVVGSRDPQVLAALDLIEDRHLVVDLVRVADAADRRADPRYSGIAW